jgi:flavin-dependent dehydrogenase
MTIVLKKIGFLLIVLLCLTCSTLKQPYAISDTQVLVVGGGTGGTAAAIQAARLGVQTVLVEPTPWLGGMLSAAGVSATDGNHRLPGGLWNEFREMIYQHYGGPDAVNTGWVSNTHFEPHVADSIFKVLCKREPNLTVLYGFQVLKILEMNAAVAVVVLQGKNGKRLNIRAKICIDGTELGDLAYKMNARYHHGMDSRSLTNEKNAPEVARPVIQDLT